MSAALRVRLRGAPGVSGGLLGLGCGTTVGRNRLANRGRAALDEPESPGILSYHQSVRAENFGVLQSIFTARDVSSRANAKEVSAQSTHFQ